MSSLAVLDGNAHTSNTYVGFGLCVIFIDRTIVYAVRLAPEEISQKLTGYEHNGVTCIGMKTDIPVIYHFYCF